MQTETASLEELVKAERSAYFKNWRAKNKDKIKQHNQNYWKRRAEKKLLAGENNE